jgi:predicted phosphodiesterase
VIPRRAAVALLIVAGCVRPGDERALLDDEVGRAAAGGISIEVIDGQAQILEQGAAGVRLRAQAPAVEVVVENPGDATRYEVIIENAVLGAGAIALVDGAEADIEESETSAPAERCLVFDLPAGSRSRLSLAPEAGATRFRFAVMGDVQTALNRFDEVLEVINEVPDLDFVMSTGDLVEDGKDEEWELLERQLEVLRIPFYSTIGNHELSREPEEWHRRFGRFNVHFVYRDVAFTFVDSGNATFDPTVRARLSEWLEGSRDRVHFFGTHYPLTDPVGTRNASFRSRKEAAAVLAELAAGEVDVTFYGHVHSYYAYSNAGIPAFISGGGGAWPERWDGIGRHFLVVDVDPATQTVEVGLVAID